MNTNNERRVGMPKKDKIFSYWDENQYELGATKQGDEWGIAEKECFACGNFIRALQRCHIVPLILGGSNELSNLHLLCPPCHFESESLPNYWNWLKGKRYNEWKYPMEHLFHWIKLHGFDLTKEYEQLDKINATNEQIQNRIIEILDACGFIRNEKASEIS